VADIKLSRDGEVTYRNYARLGYHHLTHGAYGRLVSATDSDPWKARRQQFLAHVEAVLAVYPGQVILCGPTALQVLGVALPTHLEDWENCHVMVGPDEYRPVRRGVIAHRTIVKPHTWPGAPYPVLHPVDCWLQLRQASQADLIEVGDGLLRRKKPLLTLAELNQRLAELDGRRGVKQARGIVRWLRPDTDSIYETRTRLVLVKAGLPCPTVNCKVYCQTENFVYHLDMGYQEEKVGVEYDGVVHVGDRAQMEIDMTRRRHLQDQGWLIITVTAKQLQNPSAIIRSVETALLFRRNALANAW